MIRKQTTQRACKCFKTNLCDVYHHTQCRQKTFSQSTSKIELWTFLSSIQQGTVINDWVMLTLWIYDRSDKLNEGDVAPCSSMMKGTCSAFIFLIEDLWALPHQVLQKRQVPLLCQLHSNIDCNITWWWYWFTQEDLVCASGAFSWLAACLFGVLLQRKKTFSFWMVSLLFRLSEISRYW